MTLQHLQGHQRNAQFIRPLITLMAILVMFHITFNANEITSGGTRTSSTGTATSTASHTHDTGVKGLQQPQVQGVVQQWNNVVQVKEEYVAASTEDYIMNNFEHLGYDKEVGAQGCPIWLSPQVSNQENFAKLKAYRKDVEDYSAIVKNFNRPVPDFMKVMRKDAITTPGFDQSQLCSAVRLNVDDMSTLFPSQQLSRVGGKGYVEPLLTPMRHPAYCDNRDIRGEGMRLDYLIHDFEQMCNNLKPTSRSVLIDMGASLQFHNNVEDAPIMQLLETYEKFGFQFDHIYGFEITQVHPAKFYNNLLPEKYMASYHWINAGK